MFCLVEPRLTEPMGLSILRASVGIGVNKYGWFCILVAVSLAVLTGSAAVCAPVPQEAPEELTPPATSLDNMDETDSLPAFRPPVINSFAASPETIDPGESATLSWDVSGATTVTISPAIDGAGSSSVERGIEQVWPTITTIYRLTATNEAGSSVSSTTIVVASADEAVVGYDPVSGGNQGIDLTWEQLCLSSQYQVQIAKNPEFTLIVFDSGAFAPSSATSPALPFPAGGAIASPAGAPSAIASPSTLEAGQTYYWRARVRQAATGQTILSPWSNVRSFTVKSGLPATTPYYGVQLLHPSNACIGCPVSPVCFTWSPSKETTKYRFVLAKDATFTDILADAEVNATAYEYEGTLDYSTSYFWRVMSVAPAPSDWSATFSFQTEAAPEAPPAPPPAPETPLWAWVVIAIGGILVIATIVLAFMARRR